MLLDQKVGLIKEVIRPESRLIKDVIRPESRADVIRPESSADQRCY